MPTTEYLEKLNIALMGKYKSQHHIAIHMNYAKRLLENNLPVIFDPFHLSLLIGIESAHLFNYIFTFDNYQTKLISKKNGKNRLLQIPYMDLKIIQKWILSNVLNNIKVSDQSTGFHKNKSILTNANLHLNKECVINMDIKDFFPSISFDQVFKIFYYYGYTKEMSFTFARLCCHEGSLPQGAPTSPYISNIVSVKLDKRLSCLAKKYHASYSRYADDLTFSGLKSIVNMIPTIKKIIEDEGFIINEDKTRIQRNFQKQMVTGLVVNEPIAKVPKQFKKLLKQEIYFCKKYGFANHQKKIQDDHSFYKDHLYGKAYFIKMVEPELGDKFLSELDTIDWDY